MELIPQREFISSGVWRIELFGRNIKDGSYHLWLPGGGVRNPGTGFYYPVAEETLTIPSTAEKVITVGAYDSRLNAPAEFSGRGGGDLTYPKPDLVAPGVEITAPVPGRRLPPCNRDFLCCSLCDWSGGAYDGVGDRERQRSFSVGRKSKGVSQKRGKTLAGI